MNKKLIILIFLFFSANSFSQNLEYYRASAANNAIWAFSDDIILIAGRDGKLIKTTDGGEYWERIDLKIHENFCSLEFKENSFGILASDNAIYISYNDGDSWEELYRSGNQLVNVIIDPLSSSVLFAENNTLYSINPGSPKSQVIFSIEDSINSFCVDDDIFYLVTNNKSYRIKDSEIESENSFTGIYTLKLWTIAAHDSTVLISGSDTKRNGDTIEQSLGVFYESHDFGETFIKREDRGSAKKITYSEGFFIFLDNSSVIEQWDVKEANVLLDTVHEKSYFKFMKYNIFYLQDIKRINGKTYFCGRDQIWGYINEGEAPVLMNFARLFRHGSSNGHLRGIDFIGEDIIAYGTYGLILRSDNKGITWDRIFPCDTVSDSYLDSPWYKYYYFEPCFWDSFRYKDGIRFCGSVGGDILDIYLDTVKMEFQDLAEIKLYDVARNGNNIIGPTLNVLTYSTDNGESWEEHELPSDYNFFKVAKTADENIFAVTAREYLDYEDSINNPEKHYREYKLMTFNIETQAMEVKYVDYENENSFIKIVNRNDEEFICYQEENKILFFDNEFNKTGEQEIDFAISKLYPVTEDRWIVLSYYDTLKLTTNRGKDWLTFMVGPGDVELAYDETSYLSDIKPINDEGDYIIVGNNRLIKAHIDFDAETVENTSIEAYRTPLIIYHPYPNPASNELNLKILWDRTMVSESDIEIIAYDINGTKIARLEKVNTTWLSTNYAIFTCDVARLMDGIYYMQVRAGNYSKAIPVLIFKE